MKTIRSLLVFAAAWAAAFLPTVRAAAVVGESAPDFTLTDVQGKTHTLAALKGRIVVLEWVNPECPFVVKHYASGNLPALQKKATAEGVVWFSINSGRPGAQGDYAPSEVAAWSEKTGAAPSAYLRDQDGAVGRRYGAKATPHLFVIGAEGRLAYQGAVDSIRSAEVADIARAENYVATTLAALRSGQPIKTPITQPYGCGIKY